jgi:hypothetical protein
MAIALCGALATITPRAAAEIARPPPTEDSPKTHVLALAEASYIIGINAAWYWAHTDMNIEDWDLHWDWDSWSVKLSSFDYVRFDTNYFSVNAITHSVAGLLYYQVGRANGYDMLGATALNFGTAVIWEYLVEFKERPSINDLIVNTSVGFGASEALVQVGRYFRSLRPTPVNRTMAFAFAPFEMVHAWSGVPSRPLGQPPWHRFRLWAGAGSTSFDLDSSVAERIAGLDLQLVAHRGYGAPGGRSGWTGGGAWTRVKLRLAAGRDEPDSGLPGISISTRTTYAGHYAQDISSDGRGWGRFLGLGTGFVYETRRLAVDQDRMMIAHLVGPRVELAAYDGPLALRWEVGAYGDFAMVQAHAFGPTLPFDGDPPFTTPLRRFGYYYAYGTTVDTRLVLEAQPFTLDLELAGQAYRSIDGLDRIEMDGGREDPHNIHDQRLFGHLELMMFPSAVGMAVAVDGAYRRGSWSDEARASTELTTTVKAVLKF